MLIVSGQLKHLECIRHDSSHSWLGDDVAVISHKINMDKILALRVILTVVLFGELTKAAQIESPEKKAASEER